MDEDKGLSLDGLINRRRSIRRYKPAMPPEEWIRNMIHCALQAPSPSNTQPVRFVKIHSGKIRDRLRESMAAGRRHLLEALEKKGGRKKVKNLINTYYRFSEFMFRAPVFFAVGTIRSTTGFSQKLFEAGLLESYDTGGLDIALGLALKGFILKGEALGLGSCILTAPLVFMSEPDHMLGVNDLAVRCFITVGFPDETPPAVKRKSVSEIYMQV